MKLCSMTCWIKIVALSVGLAGFGNAQASVSTSTAAITQTEPKQMVLELSNFLIDALNEQRQALEQSPKRVLDFAQQNVLPYVDTARMARYALGKHWRTANTSQQQAFVEAFTENLIRSYSQSLLNLKVEKMEVTGVQVDKRNRGTVSSTVYQASGSPANVLYRVYQAKDGKWYLYDVVLENVSLLLSYRSTYGSLVDQKGLDAVIKQLQQKNQQASSK